jgi:hypothetical protein
MTVLIAIIGTLLFGYEFGIGILVGGFIASD